jgi:hypothetical protein
MWVLPELAARATGIVGFCPAHVGAPRGKMLHMSMILALGACAEPVAVDGPTPIFDPEGSGFFDTPWPADTRLDPDGTLSLMGFPNPSGLPLLETYLATAETIAGFGTSSPVYVRFDGPFDPAVLPAPAESMTADSPLVLVDVESGEQVPVQWEQTTYESSDYAPLHLLAVAPLHGWSLRGASTYALLVTTAVARPSRSFRAQPLDPRLEPVLADLGLTQDELAIATVFTTQDPVGEMADLAWFVRNQIGMPDLNVVLEQVEEYDLYTAYRTHYLSPVFTQGDPPYTVTGGEFAFDAEGRPELVRFDDLRIAVCVPNGQEPPPSGWPVVLYQHGTGGNYRGFCDENQALESMTRFAGVGLVGVGIDQPLHGTRPGAEFASDLTHFNILNPTSARTNFRQGGLDALYLARALSSQAWTPTTPAGDPVPLDPENVLFMGHSQGGLTGALATPFFGGDVRGSVLSGAGAVLAITVVERQDPLDFAQLVRDVLLIADEEPLTELHPILGLVQTLVEITDPANYARYWLREPAPWVDHTPTDLLLTSGTADVATPYRTAVALAAAGGLPQLGAPATRAEAVWLRTGEPLPLPQSDTVTSFLGGPASAGFAQFLDGTHFVVFEEPGASDLVTHWLDTAAEGSPVLSMDAATEAP